MLCVFGLTACTSLQWYDSPIPVKVNLTKAKTPNVQNSATSDKIKQQNP